MRSNVAWIGLSLFSLLGAGTFTACGGSTDREVGSAYPLTGKQCASPGETAAAADGCNDCTCGSDHRWVCTDKACSSESGDGGGAAAECKPGETKTEDCNTCFCEEDGTWGCTFAECNPPGPEQCEPGATKKERCNDCVCTADGTWACTDKACTVECQQGENKFEDCNACWCTEAGTWDCTTKECERGPTCEDGETWRDRCDFCSCVEGKWHCTLARCLPACTPDDLAVSSDGCNMCKCDANGYWDCWTNACEKPSGTCTEGTEEAVGCMKCTCAKGEFQCLEDACHVNP